MAGAIDLYSGTNSITGVNLFKVDKNPLEQLDMGLASMVHRADSIGGALTSVIQGLIDAILGGVGGTLAQVADFFLHLNTRIFHFLEELTGLDFTHGLSGFFTSLTATITHWGESAWAWLEGITGLDWSSAVNFIESIINGVFGWFETLTGLDFRHGIVAFFTSLTATITHWGEAAWAWLEGLTGLDWSSAANFISSIFTGVLTALNTLTGLVWDQGLAAFLTSLTNTVTHWGTSVWAWLNGITHLDWTSATNFITSIFTHVLTSLNTLTGLVFDQGLAAFFTSLTASISNWESQAWTWLHSWTGVTWDGNPATFLASLTTLVAEAILNGASTLVDWFNTTVLGGAESLFTWIQAHVFTPSASGPIGAFFTNVQTLLGNINPMTLISDWTQTIFGKIPILDDNGQLGSIDIISGIDDFIHTKIINPIVSTILTGSGIDLTKLGVNVANLGAQALGALGDWAKLVLTGLGQIPANLLTGIIPPGLLGTVPVAHISSVSQNLISQGSFGDSSTITAANGWSWDSSQNATGTGGSAKTAISTQANYYLYSKQTIPIANGDRIVVNASIKTYGFGVTPFGSLPISIAIVPFIGTTAQTPIVMGNKLGSNTSWTTLGTASGDYYTVTNASWTSVIIRLGVDSTATGGTVWWDDISVTKVGLLIQNNVDTLTSAFSGLIDGLSGNTTGTTTPAPATASTMHTAGTYVTGLASTATTNASLAVNNNQTVVDAINKTVGGSTGATGASPTTVQSNFETFFTNLFGQTTPKSTIAPTAIGAGSITSTKIGPNAVNTTHITATGLTGAALADNAVITRHISTGAVGSSAIAAGAVGSTAIASNAVNATHITATGLTSAALADNAVITRHIATGAITTGSLPTNIPQANIAGTVAGQTIYNDLSSISGVASGASTNSTNTINNILGGITGVTGTYAAGDTNAPAAVTTALQNLNQALFRNNAYPGTSGNIHVNAVPTSIPQAKILGTGGTGTLTTDTGNVYSHIDGMMIGLKGTSGSGFTAAQAQAAADTVRNSIADASKLISSIQSSLTASGTPGNTASVDFTAYANATTLNSGLGAGLWTQTYPASYFGASSGTGTLGITSGRAAFASAIIDSNRASIVQYATGTVYDMQRVGVTLSSTFGGIGGSYVMIFGRMNSANTAYVVLNISSTGFQLGYQGGISAFGSTSYPVKSGYTYWLELGTSSSALRTFNVYEGSTKIWSGLTDSSSLSTSGSGYRGVGFGATSNSLSTTPSIANFNFYDTTPPPKKGSAFRASKSTTATNNITLTATTNFGLGTSTPATLPASFFDGGVVTNDYITTDMTYTSASNKLAVTKEGWYSVTVNLKGSGGTMSPGGRSNLVLFKNGTGNSNIVARGWQLNCPVGNQQPSMNMQCMVYLVANDYIIPGYESNWTNGNTSFDASSDGTSTYFMVNFVNNTIPS